MQTRYVLIGFFVASLASIDFIPKFGIGIYPFGCIFMVAWVFLTSYAIFKHHLIDINIVIRKGLVYSILVAVITFIYLILVLLSERFLQGLVGYRSLITSILIALIIALLFNPLRNKIQRFLDKRFFKGTLESLAEERERLKQELFQTEKLAYVGGLASSVVHEIKNPLTAIKTFVEYLPQKYQDPKFKEKFERLIPQEIERIEKVVHQLLDLAKPRQTTFKPVNIVNTIDTTLSLLENSLKSKRIEVRKDYISSEVIIQGDEEQLRQVFLNLFLNSIQAMNEGSTLAISVQGVKGSSDQADSTTRPLGHSVTITITDTGCGISEDNLKKLFTPFFSTKKDGVGLGLTITQEIIRQHRGEIRVESKMNQGTRFIIELPI
ncbi:MAG: hypothetical protein FJZ10_03900 [Candidatus Omnitrophica bacterium]|nr:hypothetical protein [Candidatus Omnitrophota bacterium]